MRSIKAFLVALLVLCAAPSTAQIFTTAPAPANTGTAGCTSNLGPCTSLFTYYAESRVPFILPSSGSMGNNGALTLTTALDTTYSAGAYFYMPAGAISSGSAAGWYYGVGSSTTAVTLYNNTYTSGIPSIPGTPVAFSTTGPGAYTQTTSGIVGLTLTIPGGAMGSSGRLTVSNFVSINKSTNSKTLGITYGAQGLLNQSYSSGTVGSQQFDWTLTNFNSALNVATSVPNGSQSGSANWRTINTAVNQTLLYTLQLGASTEWMATEATTITVQQ